MPVKPLHVMISVYLVALFAFSGCSSTKSPDVTERQVIMASADIAMLGVALDAFEVDTGRYPTTAEGLAALSTPPGGLTNWHGPYIMRPIMNDPCGNPYAYVCPGKHNPHSYDLYSLKTGQSTSHAVSHGSQTETVDAGNPVPVEVVQKVPALIKELKPGMTHEQVLRHLGLWGYPLMGQEGGPTSGYWLVFQLRAGYNLVLVYDYSQEKSGTFKEAYLAGTGWSVGAAQQQVT